MEGFLLLIFLIWFAWRVIKTSFEKSNHHTERINPNSKNIQQVSFIDWRDELSPVRRKFLEKYGSPKGETYSQFINRFNGQNFLDSSEEEQVERLLGKYQSNDDLNTCLQIHAPNILLGEIFQDYLLSPLRLQQTNRDLKKIQN